MTKLLTIALMLFAALSANATPPSQSTILVYRPSAFAGGARVEPVFVDGRMLGQNASGTFLLVHVGAGHHTVATTAHSLMLDADAGKRYFIKQKHSAWSPTSSLQRVTEEQGKQGVVACKPAARLF